MKKVALVIVIVLVIMLFNCLLMTLISRGAKVHFDEVKEQYSRSTSTLVFLGLLGEMKYLEPICAEIPGPVYYVHYDVRDYDGYELAHETVDALRPGLKIIEGLNQRINLIGVSMGAQAATLVAELLMVEFPWLDVQVYLLNPCMGAEQVALVKWPPQVMQFLANRISDVTLLLGPVCLIPFLSGHSLMNLQGELRCVVGDVPAYPAELVDRTHVIVSARDRLVDVEASKNYFLDCASLEVIDAEHVDFGNNMEAYLLALDRQGLITYPEEGCSE